MISKWFFHFWWAKKLREQKDSPFVLKSETENLKSSCILEILNSTERDWLSLKALVEKLGIKTIQNLRAKVFRDAFKKETVLPNLVFSENQIAKIRGKYWLTLILTLFFTVVEAALYLLTASLFVPGIPLFAQIPLAIFLSAIIMFSQNFALARHFKYREAIDRHQSKEISSNHLTSYKHWMLMGYILAFVSILAVVFAGISRIYFLENVDGTGLTAEQLANITIASKWGSKFTLCITLMTSILTAICKLQFGKASKLYHWYKAWHTAHVRRNKTTQVFIVSCERIKLTAEQKVEKYFQLITDLKRILKPLYEHDSKYQELNDEYVELRGCPVFVLDDDIYRKFSPLQSAYEELFKYGVLNDPAVKEKIQVSQTIQRVVEEHQLEHRALYKKPLLPLLPTMNGNGKTLTIIHQ